MELIAYAPLRSLAHLHSCQRILRVLGSPHAMPRAAISEGTRQRIIERLRERGYRVTQGREKLVSTLLAADRPLSAEELRKKARLAPSDLVTVYRNLEAFEAAGVGQRVLLENGTQLFELTEPDAHYHHLICRACHHAERLDVCVGQEVGNRARSKGFTQLTHHLEVYGLCRDCQGQEP